MYRYFVELAYKGTTYCGWQLQPGHPTIQGKLEDIMRLLLREPVRLTGAGRTDSGVHASCFVAHFDSEKEALHLDTQLLRKINGLAGKDIAIYRIRPVAPNAHARFDALSRTYLYRIAQTKNPFTVDLACHLYRPLNTAKMNRAAKILLEFQDFTSFSKLHGDAVTNLCNITEARWTKKPATGEIRFTITANRFLRNMVRAIVGTMIEIGTEKRPPDDIRRIIEAKNRNAAGTSAPAHGLYLTKIVYPPSLFTAAGKTVDPPARYNIVR
ncbi:MAG: tRNA pseudouridine(38-40) synthase TruA [Bacteroidales bacterium]|nr:tRNA pseudouridine(38-40) synthase TruA [Bacteroidales bacterium]